MPDAAVNHDRAGSMRSSAELEARLRELAGLFASNVHAATRDFAWHATAESELAGLSALDLERAKRRAQSVGVDGFLLTLDAHCVFPALASLQDRALRKTLYEAYYTRASDRGPRAGHFDNTAIVSEVLELRHQLALQAGFVNYGALAQRDSVIGDPDAAESALVASHRSTRARAQAELDTLWAFAKEKGVPRGFSHWDLSYYLALWQRERAGFDASSLRDYFELDACLDGALELASSQLGVTSTRAPGAAGSRTARFTLSDAGGPLGVIEVDPFGPSALLGEASVRPDATDPPGPFVRVELGFEPPWDAAASVRLVHAELETVFRCLGSALFLLTTRSLRRGQGPSRQALLGSKVAGYFYEKLAGRFSTLSALGRHLRSGQSFPRELFDSVVAERARHAALDASSELEMELFDLRVHRDHVPAAKATQLRVHVLDTFTQIRREHSVLPASYWTRFANTSTALFVQDEAGRLWERSWARKMASDLFAALESATDDAGAAEARLRETFWATGDSGVLERLTGALGAAPQFGR